MLSIKQVLKGAFHQFGFEIQRVPRFLGPTQVSVGHDAYQDMRRLTAATARPDHL